jgi:hypothetical protein
MSYDVLEGRDRELVQIVDRAYQRAEPEHRTFRGKAEEFYRLYRGFTDFREHARDFRDRDAAVSAAVSEWGAELFIPFIYSTIETIIPRMVAKGPRMLVVPRDEQAFGNVRNMKIVVDAQCKQIGYEIVLQVIAKDGLIYGIGVGKTRWKYEKRLQVRAEPSPLNPSLFVEGQPRDVVAYDDAVAERVDPFDFMWDPNGDDIPTVEYVIHRLWRSPAQVARNVKLGIWRAQENDPECPWTLEDLLNSRARTQRSDVWDQRLSAEGYNTQGQRQDGLHEVWEFHDGTQVVSVLDATYPVQAGPNPSGQATIPFQVYRPTVVGGRFIGISEVEPIRHLQYEINTLRSQRRDAATLSLMRTFAYNETAVDADDLVFGPNMAIPVNGDPRDFLFPIPVPELPASSYREEQAIISDIERTSGISDPVTGGDTGASETATGVQLVQAAATMRIQNKARLLETQIIVPQGFEFVALNQRRILTDRVLAISAEPDPNNPTVPAWKMVKIGPKELMGRMAVEVEGGSTAPENVPQQRADSQALVALSQDPRLNGEKLLIRALQLLGIDQPEGYVKPTVAQVPADQIQAFLAQLGIPPEMFVQFLDQQAAQQGQPQGQPDMIGGPTVNGAQGAALGGDV